jgi:hypothetical protein
VLLTIDYLEAAMGKTFSDEEAGQVQFLIDGVSSYIETYTGTAFSPVVDQTIRFRSDSYGCIPLFKHPVTNVSVVHDYRDNFDLVAGVSYIWDGLQTIRGLRTRHVYDVTFSYGYDPCPLAVQVVATKAVMRGLSSTPSNLKALTVGDITEQYGDMLDFSDADVLILDNFKDTEGTIRLDAGIDSEPYGWGPDVLLNGPDWWYWDE